MGRSSRRAKAPGTKVLKTDVIIFLSSSETVLMQVHLDTAQGDLNAWGVEREQDSYQTFLVLEISRNLMICIIIS
ncbi:hypothetical protein D3C85_1822240 [compost metagenome]